MANSRTKILIPMLVLSFFAVTAYGQAVLTLGSNPTRVRSEGITEVIGLITMSNNTNQVQVIPGGTTLSVVYDGNITNNPAISTVAVTVPRNANIYTTGVSAAGNSSGLAVGGVTATTASVTFPASNTMQITIPAGFVNNGTGACAAAPATATTLCLIPGGSFNIEGVRVNVAGLTGNVNAVITTTPANAVTFPGGINSTVVGRAQATLGSVTATAAAIAQCGVPLTPSSSAAGLATYFSGTSAALGVGGAGVVLPAAAQIAILKIAEPSNYPLAFTSTADEDQFTPSPGSPVPGSGSTAVSTTPGFQGTAGTVTNGIQFVIAITGVPAGITLIVPSAAALTTGATASVLTVQLTNATPAQIAVPGTGVLISPTGGAATLTYTLFSTTGASATTVDTLNLPIAFTAATGTVVPLGSLGAANVTIGPTSTVTTLSATAPTVRFVTGQTGLTAATVGTIAPCLTNLLFPFVSNRTGTTFNTGIAISNTANDSSFGTKGVQTGEPGGVTLYFFGVSAPTGGTAGITLPIAAVSTGGTVATANVIAPGEHTAFVLNDGSTKAIAPAFQGYIVALCQFRYAHGLATIFDNFGVGPANVGFSYLALVLSGSPAPRTGTNNVFAPEVLGH